MKKFFKVYSAPGYPVDPVKQEKRILEDSWINYLPISDRRIYSGPFALDYERLRLYEAENCN